MIELISGLLGIITGAIPEVMKLYRDASDKKHELSIMNLQIQQQEKMHEMKISELNASADIAEIGAMYKHDASLESWLQKSVRPVITYLFFFLFAAIKISAIYYILQKDAVNLDEALEIVWDSYTAALFSLIMGFWFGARQFQKIMRHDK